MRLSTVPRSEETQNSGEAGAEIRTKNPRPGSLGGEVSILCLLHTHVFHIVGQRRNTVTDLISECPHMNNPMSKTSPVVGDDAC